MKTLIATMAMVLSLGLLAQEASADVNGCYIYLSRGCPMHPSIKPGFLGVDSYAGTVQCKRRAHDYLEWCFMSPAGVVSDFATAVTYYNKNDQWTGAFAAYRSSNVPYTAIYMRAGGTETDEYVGSVQGRP